VSSETSDVHSESEYKSVFSSVTKKKTKEEVNVVSEQ
jgi:hypothetical protein